MHACTHMYTYKCIYIYMYICIPLGVYIYAHVHTHYADKRIHINRDVRHNAYLDMSSCVDLYVYNAFIVHVRIEIYTHVQT